MPEVSVVIPTHGGRFVGAAIGSVIAQTMTNWELVIVDDGSRDGTAALAARFAAEDARIRVVTLARNAGAVAARNEGLRAISPGSGHVAFLDHDDLWTPDALALLDAALRAAPSASAAHGRAYEIDPDGRTLPPQPGDARDLRLGLSTGRVIPWPADRPTEFANLVFEDCIASTGSGLIRRTALDRVGGFDPRAERADDYDLWVRLSRLGPIAFVDHPVLAYRLHRGQTSHLPALPRGRGVGYVRYKMIASSENTPAQRRLAIAAFRARQREQLLAKWPALQRAYREGHYREVPWHVVDALARVAAYVRGRPWSWHR